MQMRITPLDATPHPAYAVRQGQWCRLALPGHGSPCRPHGLAV